MKKPDLQDFTKGFQYFKALATGTEVKFSFLYPVGNLAAHAKYDKYKLDLLPQREIVDILNSMIPFVATYEGYSAALIFDHLNGDNVLLAQEIEQKRLEFMGNLFVTGISLSGQEDKKNVQISYKKIAKDGKINGHSTQCISINGNAFGFEQDLEEIIEKLICEVYDYVYNDKYSDSDQSELSIWQSGHEVIGEEEEPIIENEIGKEKAIEPDSKETGKETEKK